jgi:hypothetical protein
MAPYLVPHKKKVIIKKRSVEKIGRYFFRQKVEKKRLETETRGSRYKEKYEGHLKAAFE